MPIPIYHVDAFTNRVFHGNPAAVCPLDRWLDDDAMQAIAAENNLSETAFFVRRGSDVRPALVHAGDRGRSVRTRHARVGARRVHAPRPRGDA